MNKETAGYQILTVYLVISMVVGAIKITGLIIKGAWEVIKWVL